MPRTYAVTVGRTGLDLPRVAWEGGPSYYERFTAMQGTAWTSDSYFPILYWGAYCDTQAKIDRYASLGITGLPNAYATNGSTAGWIRNAGLWNMSGPMGSDGAEWVASTIDDEVDMWAGAGFDGWTGNTGFVPNVCVTDDNNRACGYTAANGLYSTYVQPGKAAYLNWGKTVLVWGTEDAGATFVNGARYGVPGVTWDISWASGDMYFYTDSGAPSEAPNFLAIPSGEVRRAANYGEWSITWLRRLSGLGNNGVPRHPVGTVVELSGQTSNSGPDITGDQVVGAVMSTIVHEARMVEYFSHGFAATALNPWTNNALWDDAYADTQAKVGALNLRLASLAPVLNTQSYVWEFNPTVSTMLKAKSGYAYVFAMAKRAATHSTSARTFTLPPGVNGTTVDVIGESRTLPVSAGTFSDAFAAEYSSHIYKVAI